MTTFAVLAITIPAAAVTFAGLAVGWSALERAHDQRTARQRADLAIRHVTDIAAQVDSRLAQIHQIVVEDRDAIQALKDATRPRLGVVPGGRRTR